MYKIISKVMDNYPGTNSTTEQSWDFIQRKVSLNPDLWPDSCFVKRFSIKSSTACFVFLKQVLKESEQ